MKSRTRKVEKLWRRRAEMDAHIAVTGEFEECTEWVYRWSFGRAELSGYINGKTAYEAQINFQYDYGFKPTTDVFHRLSIKEMKELKAETQPPKREIRPMTGKERKKHRQWLLTLDLPKNRVYPRSKRLL